MNRAHLENASPLARITGAVYLLYFVAAISAQLLTVRGSSATRLTLNLVADALYLAVTVMFYRLFRPVSRGISLIAAVFSLTGCAVMILAQLHFVDPRLSPLIFFGPFCVLIGWLILRSIFLPKLLGILLILAGLGWIIYPIPGLPHALTLAIQVLGIFAEGLLMLWLLAKGIPEQRWLEQSAMSVRP